MKRTEAPARGVPCWIDMSSNDLERTTVFYTGLFGWEAQVQGEEYGGYVLFTQDGAPVAGAGPSQMPGMPDMWGVYLRSESIADDVAAATAAGATPIMEPMEIPAMGVMTGFTDPAGAAIFFWEPRGHHGFGVVDEPGAPTWFELAARDYPTASEFYTTVFGWSYEGTPGELTYGIASVAGSRVAGVMNAGAFLPEGVPSHWSFYLGVPNIEDACAKVVELGGGIVMPPENSPFGKLASVHDSGGGQFKLHELAPGWDQ